MIRRKPSRKKRPRPDRDPSPATLRPDRDLSAATLVVGFPRVHSDDPYQPGVVPIYQCAAFEDGYAAGLPPRSPTMCAPTHDIYAAGLPEENWLGCPYSRIGNPTLHAFEECVSTIEGSESTTLAYSSGMAALSAVFALIQPRTKVIVPEDRYGGTDHLIQRVSDQGVEVITVDASDTAALTAAIQKAGEELAMVFLETPSNPRMRVTDVRKAVTAAHGVNALVAVDATMLSPLQWQPLSLGVDLSIHSGTKHLCGHGDTLCGVVSTPNQVLLARLKSSRSSNGSTLAPFEAWLMLRGMRTLWLRVAAAQHNAAKIVDCLVAHAESGPLPVRKVYWPGRVDTCETRDQFEVHRSQVSGPLAGGGSVVSFECGSSELAARMVQGLRLFKKTVGYGGVASSASVTHGDPAGLVRLSIGVEDAGDLVADIVGALEQCRGEASAR